MSRSSDLWKKFRKEYFIKFLRTGKQNYFLGRDIYKEPNLEGTYITLHLSDRQKEDSLKKLGMQCKIAITGRGEERSLKTEFYLDRFENFNSKAKEVVKDLRLRLIESKMEFQNSHEYKNTPGGRIEKRISPDRRRDRVSVEYFEGTEFENNDMFSFNGIDYISHGRWNTFSKNILRNQVGIEFVAGCIRIAIWRPLAITSSGVPEEVKSGLRWHEEMVKCFLDVVPNN